MTADSYTIASGTTLYAGCNPPSTGGGSLPAWLATANPAVGQYVSIPNSNLSSVPRAVTGTIINGQTGPQSKIVAYAGAAFNRLTGDYTVGPHGGHKDYGGNEFDAINIFADAPAWAEWAPASQDAEIYALSDYYRDYRPASKHSYSLTHWLPSIGKCVMMPIGGYDLGATFPVGWPYTGGIYGSSFDINTKMYDHPSTIAPYPGTGDPFAALCCMDPVTETIYMSNNYGDGIYSYVKPTNTWTKISSIARAPWYCSASVDHSRNRMLVVGGYTATAPAIFPLNGSTPSFPSITGPNAADWTFATPSGALIYDELHDCYLLFKNSGAFIDNWRLDASTFYADKPTRTGTLPAARLDGNGGPAGLYNSLQYVPNIGGWSGIVGASTYTGNMFFLRLS